METETNTFINTKSNLDQDSDSDEYIDLSVYAEENLKHMFQFHLINEKLIIKYIGKSTDTPDIIIIENFGPDSNMSLYNCVYSQDELESIGNNEYNEIDKPNKLDGHDALDNKGTIIGSEFGLEQKDLDNKTKYLELFFPIVKLIIKSDSENHTISSIAVRLNQKILFGKEIQDWELYWIENSRSNKEYFKTIQLEKNINPTNILENIIKLSV